MKKFNLILIALVILIISAISALAAETVPGDVLVVFKNNTEDKVSASSLKSAGLHNDAGSHFALAETAAASVGGSLSHVYTALSEQSNSVFALVHSDTKSEEELLAELKERPDVQGASLNYIRQPHAAPNDTYYERLWGTQAVSADKVWDEIETTPTDVTYVVVIDTGIDVDHEDLKGVVATDYCRAWGATNPDEENEQLFEVNDYSDINTIGHGTHVSGTIAAIGNNSKGITGMGYKANVKIIMLKPYIIGYGFPDSATIAALNEAVTLKKDKGVNIAAVNMSLGGWDSHRAPEDVSNSSDPFWSALKLVSDNDMMLCISAGNESQQVGYPAPITYINQNNVAVYKIGDYVYPASFRNIPNMIVVAAASMDADGVIFRSMNEAGSNYGSEYVHITAPGADIISTVPTDYLLEYAEGSFDKLGNHPENREYVDASVDIYANWSGTSMAAPHVTGAVALLRAAFPKATATQIRDAIFDGANGNYCKNDSDDIVYYDEGKHNTDNTSKYGFLDVKAAYDILANLETTKDVTALAYEPSVVPTDGRLLNAEEIITTYENLPITSLDETLQGAANTGTMRAVGTINQIKPDNTGKYYIKVKLNSTHAAGSLCFFPGKGGTVNTSSIEDAEFKNAEDDSFTADVDKNYDSNAKFYAITATDYTNPITTLNASDTEVIVAADFEAGEQYTPVISVYNRKKKKDKHGCDAGALGGTILMLAAAGLILGRKAR